jgi:DNA-binding response OmpR family regulator/HPt (histidine-containing phosphotransfer) domain-containing protein
MLFLSGDTIVARARRGYFRPMETPIAPPEIARLRERFRATQSNTVAAFDRLAAQLATDPKAAEVLEALRRELHRLRGTAGSFGFNEVSRLATGFEQRANNWTAYPTLELHERENAVRRFIERLERAFSEEDDDSATVEKPIVAMPSLVFVGSGDLEVALKNEGSLRGITILTLSVAECTAETIRELAPHAVFAQLPLLRSVVDAARSMNLPLIALEHRPRDKRNDRSSGDVTIVHAAAVVDVLDGVGPAFDIADQLFVLSNWSGATILAVDDDPIVLMLLRAIFPQPEFDLQTLQDATKLIEMIAPTDASLAESPSRDPRAPIVEGTSVPLTDAVIEPALLVLDVEMPGTNGLDLLAQIRKIPALSDLAIILLSGRADAATRNRAFALGADEFIAKPIVVSELKSRVTDRLERRRAARLAAGLHPATAIALPERMFRDGDEAIAFLRAERKGGVIVAIRPTEPTSAPTANAAWMRETARLAKRLRTRAIAVGYGEDQDLIAVAPLDVASATVRLNRHAATAPKAAPRWRAGLVALDDLPDATFAEARRAAVEAANAAMHSAEVVRLWQRSDSLIAPDVVLVEDDPSLSDMIQYALKATGFTFSAFDNGNTALDALRQYDTQGRRPIVLLDVDLPGIDGYTLHERLRVERPGDYSIVFVTVHAGETDQLRALRAGAMDYITKPVNLRILMAKMTSWLAASPHSSQ